MAILPVNIARVSNTLRSNIASGSIAGTEAQLLNVQNELTTGHRLNVPSDDTSASTTALQLQKLLEQRQAYSSNLKSAASQLGLADGTLGDITQLIQQAQTAASAAVGSDVTDEEREGYATTVDSIYTQLLSLANKQNGGAYLFGGDKATDAPFVETVDGVVQFVGSAQILSNNVDENSQMAFQVNGSAVFGATASRVTGSADLSPSLSPNTRLADLSGAGGLGVHPGVVTLSDGTTSAQVDLTDADTIGDVITRINASGVGSITASIASSGNAIQLAAGAGDDITITDAGGGSMSSDLGISTPTGAGAGTNVVGQDVGPKVTGLTPLAALKNGAGIDLTSGLKISNGSKSVTIDLSGSTTVEDLLNKINGAGVAVKAQVNAAGTGIDILNTTQGVQMSIGENGGTTAADLGLRSFDTSTPLAQLNDGKGVRTAAGADFKITDSAGVAFDVDLDGPPAAATVNDVLAAINAAATTAGAGVTASLAANGNGIALIDGAAGPGTLAIDAQNFSNAAADLGLSGVAAAGGTIQGADVNRVQPDGVFSHIIALRNAMRSNDKGAMTDAAESLQKDYDKVVQVRGVNGAQLQEISSRQDRLGDQNLATQSLLSDLRDTDFTDAISRYQLLQTSLQATLQTTAQVLNLSLLDFLA